MSVTIVNIGTLFYLTNVTSHFTSYQVSLCCTSQPTHWLAATQLYRVCESCTVTSRISYDTYVEFFSYKKYHVNFILSVTKSVCCRSAVHCCTNLSSDSTTQITISVLLFINCVEEYVICTWNNPYLLMSFLNIVCFSCTTYSISK